jgi:hypothetical protein
MQDVDAQILYLSDNHFKYLRSVRSEGFARGVADPSLGPVPAFREST